MQLVLLYERKSWLVMGAMIKVLEEYHHRASRQISGITAECTTSVEWEWPLVADMLETSGLWEIKEHTQQRQATILLQAAFESIYEMCTG